MEKKIKQLKCKECERPFEPKALHVCDFCFGPLEADYNYDAIKKNISRASIEKGPVSLWRYWDLLPVESRDVITLEEGYTPLLRAKNLGKLLGLNNLYVKNDSTNPTFSFKDRVGPWLSGCWRSFCGSWASSGCTNCRPPGGAFPRPARPS
jgi:threonine synthase